MMTNVILLTQKKRCTQYANIEYTQKNIAYFLRNKFQYPFLNKIVLPFWDNFNVLCCLLTKKERKNFYVKMQL